MIINCPYCNQSMEVQDNASGQVQCPSCRRSFLIQPPSSISKQQMQVFGRKLCDAKENTAWGWLIFFSLIGWILFVILILVSAGGLLVTIGIVALVKLIMGLWAVAHIKTNAVEVSENQFPGIYSIAKSFAERLGKPLPRIYIMQENVWNSLAMKVAGKRYVILFSGAIDSLLLKGSITQLSWLVGHELGHHFAGHLNFWRWITELMGAWCLWVWMWYKRRCEFTCDRHGLACANNLNESLRALCNMAVGAHLASAVNIDEGIAQWNKYRSDFFVKYRTLYSTHPHILWRIEELKKSAEELGIQ